MGWKQNQQTMYAVAEWLEKTHDDTTISARAGGIMFVVKGHYTVVLHAERHFVDCKVVVDSQAGQYNGPDGKGDPEPWENHCSLRFDEAFTALGLKRDDYGFLCFLHYP